MSVSINGTNGLTFSDASTQNTSPFPGGLAFRNRIINGAMMIDQRNDGSSVSNIGGSLYTLDRWLSFGSQASKFTIQQNAGSVTPPVGFSKYLGITSSSAYSVGGGEAFVIQQSIEGLNVSDLAWGTSSAATVTLSFWVRSSLTGTFGGAIRNGSYNRSYPFIYTVSSANTWTQVSISVAGDTSGTWATDNSIGINVVFGLGVGSTYSGTAGAWSGTNYNSATGATSVVGTNGATFYITGVQLEKGSTATSFDYRPYGTELALCQRYLPRFSKAGPYGSGYHANASVAGVFLPFAVPTRVAPTGITTSAASGFGFNNGSGTSVPSALSFNANTTTTGAFIGGSVSGAPAGGGCILTGGASSFIQFDGCEL